ncbi:questin oxidase family protein [Chromobacterium sphagni]|uniref:DUF4243 domain-containing protein n=1 Tax=Chromobacterium sphagni TaxID=1903179 RepID=A0A1S1WYD3_9NEIS|nr:questin oxidase family protein [Chromobacterium sphagni]OHX12272.1 hypothetical protein BI347_01200 [Chromobacterium sphagni]OHX21644.1 hypothetical protein BI344_03810 [Chromobacterium sphagni]
MMQDLLSPLLAYSGSYRGGLSNHLPMELQALAELGADEGQLRRHAARHGHLEFLQDDGRDIADTCGWLGDEASEAAWRRRFAWERRQGEWLRHWAGRLRLVQAAPAGASFHGLIRLAYALRGGVDGEIDAALAYALSHWKLLDLPGQSPSAQTLPDLLADWRRSPILLPPQGGLILDDIERALALAELSARLPPGLLGSAREQRRYCRLLFLATRDLDALHLITAWEAALSLARAQGLAEVADSTALQMQAALIGVFIYCGCPALDVAVPQMRRDAAAIRRMVLRLQDAHSIKLALSCLWLAGMEGDAAWLALAEQTAQQGWKAIALA